MQGDVLDDEQKKVLRDKHVNVVTDIEGIAIAPVGWGTMADGSSAWCRLWATKLIREIEWHQVVLTERPKNVQVALDAMGVCTSDIMDLRLVLLDDMDTSNELAEHLREGNHLSRGLYALGFAIVEATSGFPVTVTQADYCGPTAIKSSTISNVARPHHR